VSSVLDSDLDVVLGGKGNGSLSVLRGLDFDGVRRQTTKLARNIFLTELGVAGLSLFWPRLPVLPLKRTCSNVSLVQSFKTDPHIPGSAERTLELFL